MLQPNNSSDVHFHISRYGSNDSVTECSLYLSDENRSRQIEYLKYSAGKKRQENQKEATVKNRKQAEQIDQQIGIRRRVGRRTEAKTEVEIGKEKETETTAVEGTRTRIRRGTENMGKIRTRKETEIDIEAEIGIRTEERRARDLEMTTGIDQSKTARDPGAAAPEKDPSVGIPESMVPVEDRTRGPKQGELKPSSGMGSP